MTNQNKNEYGGTSIRLGPNAARRVGAIQFVITFATSFWVMGYQRPPAAAVAFHIGLPWLAVGIAACFPQDLTLSLEGGDARKPLSAAWFMNVISLVLLFRCVTFVNWTHAIWIALIPGVALFLLAVLAESRTRVMTNLLDLMFLLLASIGCGYGMVRELNVLLDHSPDLVVSSTVLAKSREKTTAVNIEPWGPVTEVKNIMVPADVFDLVHMGGPVCMVVRSGALGINWYTAQACPWKGGTVSLAPDNILPVLPTHSR